jgi:hypothetical protein
MTTDLGYLAYTAILTAALWVQLPVTADVAIAAAEDRCRPFSGCFGEQNTGVERRGL